MTSVSFEVEKPIVSDANFILTLPGDIPLRAYFASSDDGGKKSAPGNQS